MFVADGDPLEALDRHVDFEVFCPVLIEALGYGERPVWADAGQVSSWRRNGRRGADLRGTCSAMARPQRGLVRWAGLIFGGQPERAADLTNERHGGVPVRCAQMAFKGPSTCSELPPRNKITKFTVPEPGDKLQGIQARRRPDCRRHAGVCPTPTDERARERTGQDRRERL